MNTDIRDHFEERYFRKLWEMLPAVYRSADEDLQTGTDTLRAFVELIVQQAAVLHRSIDRLWDDEFIATCDDWVIPYIADLVGTNVVIEGVPAAWRRDVANTILYRRRKGTPAVLEQIAFDMTLKESCFVTPDALQERVQRFLQPPPSPVQHDYGVADSRT